MYRKYSRSQRMASNVFGLSVFGEVGQHFEIWCEVRNVIMWNAVYLKYLEGFHHTISKCRPDQQIRETNKLTVFHTPLYRVLLQKLTGLQLVKKFPAFHGTWRFITALTSARHLSLTWASPIQSIYTHPTSWRSIILLSTHLRLDLPTGLFPSGCTAYCCTEYCRQL